MRVAPIILCCGSGTRLWPVSRDSFPKQFVPLLGVLSTFQGTLRRVSDAFLFTRPIVVTNEKLRFLAEEQATAIGVAIDVITEPVPRASAAAIADSAHYLIRNRPDTTGHGKQLPIDVTYLSPSNPITKGLENWTTINEELYNNIRVHDGITQIAKGKQGDAETVIAWTNEYGDKKTRVFSTTLGHNNDTVADARYLDFVTRGLLWACGKLDAEGKPTSGYRPAAATAK